jgi:hypothetical protein
VWYLLQASIIFAVVASNRASKAEGAAAYPMHSTGNNHAFAFTGEDLTRRMWHLLQGFIIFKGVQPPRAEKG